MEKLQDRRITEQGSLVSELARKNPLVAVVAYNAGNIKSMQFALERLGAKVLVTDNPEVIRSSPRVIFPGVGEASYAMEQLEKRQLRDVLTSLTQPFLGVCLGMQLMCQSSEEGNTLGLGMFRSQVKRFPRGIEKVPHMGWNTLEFTEKRSALLHNLHKEACYYYVHSYYATPSEDTLATANHILPFSSVLYRDNYYGVQFHPEKSGAPGARLLQNFLTLE